MNRWPTVLSRTAIVVAIAAVIVLLFGASLGQSGQGLLITGAVLLAVAVAAGVTGVITSWAVRGRTRTVRR